jgi:outer membrane protein TolC
MGTTFPVRSPWCLVRGTAFALTIGLFPLASSAQSILPWLHPEQRTIEVRDPSQLPKARIPELPPPPTVTDPQWDGDAAQLALDDVIRIALENARVVRVLTGIAATSSGRTIYDPAISNTLIDQQQARFDPSISVQNQFQRFEFPQAFFDPGDPRGARIDGTRDDQYGLGLDVTQPLVTGGNLNFGITTNSSRFRPDLFPLNPQDRTSTSLSLTQPLLQGGGIRANMAPIVIARIDTERSFFQFKDSMQELVRGVVEAYWNVVFARTDLWARQQQAERGRAAFELAEAQARVGIGDASRLAQARVAYANFRASLVGAEANLLQREAALRNILGLPPTEPARLIPVTPPIRERIQPNWRGLVELAEERRPDLIELKLILEADEQLLLLANNEARPRLDAVMLYRWNGLEGVAPSGTMVSSTPGQFNDWTLGVNFSVPLGLRQGRASLRQRELVLARDRANLDQGLHNAIHILAQNLRNLEQFHEQYLAFKETREAARLNLERQWADNAAGRVNFLNFLQAITDWGNAVSAEADALTRYNIELANLERQSGTILETHGIRFVEERFGTIGPLGRFFPRVEYPAALSGSENLPRYERTDQPAEESFDLQYPGQQRFPLGPRLERLPPPLVRPD